VGAELSYRGMDFDKKVNLVAISIRAWDVLDKTTNNTLGKIINSFVEAIVG
jgi:hypothetical protein